MVAEKFGPEIHVEMDDRASLGRSPVNFVYAELVGGAVILADFSPPPPPPCLEAALCVTCADTHSRREIEHAAHR